MERLTLDETWKNCLSMWRWIAKQRKRRWIAKQRKQGSHYSVDSLKYEWLKKNHYIKNRPCNDCYFCEYVDARNHNECKFCPGKKIDKFFHCNNTHYHWCYTPIAFYNKLVSLNRKRLAKKK